MAHRGLHRGPVAGLGRGLTCGGGGDLLGEQGQAQLHVGQLNANVACAHKGRQVTAANQQHVHVDQRLVFRGIWFVLYASQLDLAFAAFNAKVAFDLDEAEHVEHQAAHQAGALTGRAVQGELKVGAWAGGNGQLGVARGGRVGAGCRQAVVHHRLVAGLAVDGQGHAVDFNGQALHAHKSGFAHAGLDGGPVAGFGGSLDLLGQKRQAQLHVGELHAHVACAHKGLELGAANEQLVHLDQGFVNACGFWVVFNAGQLDRALAGFNAKVAFDFDEAEHVKLQAAHQARHLAGGAVQGQLQVRRRAGGHAQAGVAGGGRVGFAFCEAVVHHGLVTGHAVDRQAHVLDGHGQAFHAFESHLVHRCLHGGPVACLGRSLPFRRLGHLLCQQGQAQLHALEVHTNA